MKPIRGIVVAAAIACALSACGKTESKRPDPPPVKDTAFGPMVGAMDRARSVEGTTMQHKDNIDKALESNDNSADK